MLNMVINTVHIVSQIVLIGHDRPPVSAIPGGRETAGQPIPAWENCYRVNLWIRLLLNHYVRARFSETIESIFRGTPVRSPPSKYRASNRNRNDKTAVEDPLTQWVILCIN